MRIKGIKTLSVIFAVIMLLGNFTAVAAEREIVASGTYGEVNWILYTDGELYIYGEGVLGKPSINTKLPWEAHASNITKITIGKSVSRNDNSTLSQETNYLNLKQIAVEEGNLFFLTDEHGVLFNYDRTLLILFPASCELSEYKIPDSVAKISNYAFRCAKLQTVTINSSVTIIGTAALAVVTRLKL